MVQFNRYITDKQYWEETVTMIFIYYWTSNRNKNTSSITVNNKYFARSLHLDQKNMSMYIGFKLNLYIYIKQSCVEE